MKSLKPNFEQNTATLIGVDVVQELKQQLAALTNANSILSNQIADIEASISKQNTTKESGTFDTITVRNIENTNKLNGKSAEFEGIKADSIETDRLDVNSVVGNDVKADVVSGITAKFNEIETEEVHTSDISSESATIDEVHSNKTISDTVSADNLNVKSAVIDDLTVTKLSTQQEITTQKVTSEEISSDKATLAEAAIDEANITLANIEKLFNQNKVFVTDDTDAKQFIVLGEPNDGSNGNDDARYIEIPNIESGFYRIDVKGPIVDGDTEDNTLFSVTCINTETAPIVHYSKSNDGDIGKIYYDILTRKWYIETYASGYIYWSNDDRDGHLAPVIYSELPIDESLLTTLHYTASAHQRLVIMGDHSADYGISIQGIVEADIIKTATDKVELFYFGNTYSTLKTLAEKHLTWEEPVGVKHYAEAELAGYLYHTEDSYMNDLKTEHEALEKIAYDGTTITLTVDTKYGQDDIEIDDGDGEDTWLEHVVTVEDYELATNNFYLKDDNYIEITGVINDDDPAIYTVELADGSTFDLNEGEDLTYYTKESNPMADELPFILSFNLSTWPWDKSANYSNFNREI